MVSKITWAAIVIAIIAILYDWFVPHGLPPGDYLRLIGLIAIALGAFILIVKRS